MFKQRLFTFACIFLLVAMLIAPSSTSSAHAAVVTNPGFEEDNNRTTPPLGWTVTGATEASYTDWGGHSGNWRLSNWSPNAYVVETSQTLTDITNGWYTLRAWVKSSGGQNAAYIALKNCGGADARTELPVAPPSQWVQIVASAHVTGGL